MAERSQRGLALRAHTRNNVAAIDCCGDSVNDKSNQRRDFPQLDSDKSKIIIHRPTIYSVIAAAMTLVAGMLIDSRTNPYIAQLVLLTAIGVLIVEIGILLSSTGRVRALTHAWAEHVEGVVRLGNGQREMMNDLMGIFSHPQGLGYIAVQDLVRGLLSNVKLRPRSIEISGEEIARLAYEHFWQGLLDAQRLQSNLKSPQNISVFITHTAPLETWAYEKEGHLRFRQEEFVKFGGRIYQVVQHTNDINNDNEFKFDKFIAAIRAGDVVEACYLDLRKVKDDEAARLQHNSLCATVDGKHYVFIWDIKIFNDEGRVEGCKIGFGDQEYLLHRDEWHLRDNLIDRPPVYEDMKGRLPVQAPRDYAKEGLPALALKPSPKMREGMRQLP